MVKTRCKFVVSEVKKENDCTSVKMSPVMYDKNGAYNVPEENKAFFAFTPAGEFSATVTNDSLDGIKEGDEYYIDLTPCK